MKIGVVFWVLMILWLVFGIFGASTGWFGPSYHGYSWYGHGLFAFVLFGLLGWKVFGSPVQDSEPSG